MPDLKTWTDLRSVGVMLGITPGQIDRLAEELLAIDEEWRGSMTPGCVTLDFAGVTFPPSVSDHVGRLRALLPKSLIAGINLGGSVHAQKFGCAGGNFFTAAPGTEIGPLQAGSSWLPWAYNAGDLRHGCYRLPPYHGIDMLVAVRHWASCDDRQLIACFRGVDELVGLVSGVDALPTLAAAGTLAIEIWLEDLLEIMPDWGLYGLPTSNALEALRQMKAEFLEGMPMNNR